MNALFVAVTLLSVLIAAATGRMEALTGSIVTSARSAVELAIGLVGVMAFFLGLMRVAEQGGVMSALARVVRPVMRRLFPEIPADHPAISAMILNISANMLGLGNAATPFGIKAIQELDRLNSRPGTATNAMTLFLAINTAGLALLPTGMIGVRAALGSNDPAGIVATTWFASGMATVVGITAAILLARLPRYQRSEPPPVATDALTEGGAALNAVADPAGDAAVDEPPLPPERAPARVWAARGFWLVVLALAARDLLSRLGAEPLTEAIRGITSFWMLPAIVAAFVLYGWVRRVRVYDALVEGARQGFDVALRIIPYLVAILVAVGMFRAAGGIDALVGVLGPITGLVGLPAEVLPVALLRPLSGSGALGVASETLTAYGPDSLIGYLASTIYGSTETTFYTLAVYFGAIGVRQTRHTLPACLLADAAGILAATAIVNLLFG
ncbi:MAG: spore maturation protein [Acidobacteria bacterium]|nr:spore maturation protein [Acidobacteriota bacterium]MYD71619.1 spore maturation protein [Acidobacteriota bacterium]MYJ04403.1 spore maturation protein [Acidobacteriota bacterium]